MVLDRRLSDPKLHMSASDRAFARVLALGVTATQGTLDNVIDRCLKKPTDIKPDVRDALRVSTYEIIYLDKPAHVAVDQGVNLVRLAAPHAAGLANAVLHKVVRLKPRFPFGDPKTSDEALALLCGFPLWLCKFLIEELGRDEAWKFMEASNSQAPVYIGVNAIRTSVPNVVRKLDEEMRRAQGRASKGHGDRGGLSSSQTMDDCHAADQVFIPQGSKVFGCLKARDAHIVSSRTAHRLFTQGDILISDAAAQKIAGLSIPNDYPSAGFLEIGAGRGTKTILLQSSAQHAYGRQMPLYSIDSEQFKVDLIEKRNEIYGVTFDKAICADGRDLDQVFPHKAFDGVLVDAPCSGLGTLRRHPEIRWRITEDDIAGLALLGAQLLISASRHVAPGGLLTYATCTIARMENEVVVEKFLASPYGRDFTVVESGISEDCPSFFKTSLKENACDAHFAARLMRNA